VNASGNVSLGDHLISAGLSLGRAEDPGRPGARPQDPEVTTEADTCQITVDSGVTITAPRTTSRDIRRPGPGTKPPAAACLSAAPADRTSSSFRHAEQHGRP
jgi:hypothetical protein